MNLLKKMSVYTVANFLNKGIVFLLIPVLTAYLTPAEQGNLSLFLTTLGLVTPLVLLQITAAINVEYFRKDFGEQNFSTYTFTGLCLSGIAFLGLTLVFFLFRTPLLQLLEFDPLYLLLIPFIALCTACVEVLKINYIIKGEAVAFGGFLLLLTFLDIGLSLYFITVQGLGMEGRIFGILAGKAMFACIALLLLYRKGLIQLKWASTYAKDLLRFGLPLLPHAIGGIVLHSSDQFFISEMVGKDALGIYSVAYQIGAVIMLVDISFNQAFTPYVLNVLKSGNEADKVKVVRASYAYALGLFICFGVMLLFLPYLYEFFVNERYASGIIYVPYIALGYVVLGLYKIFVNYLFFLKETKVIGAITLSSALLNILLNYLVIPHYGAFGAAMTTLFTFVVFFTLTAGFASRKMPMPWLKALKFKR